MIESITLLNFQRHRKLTVELDQFITCLTGDTDAGKSSVLRALYWLCFNRPSGIDMVRHGRKTATVSSRVDGVVVSRLRSKQTNLYRLDGTDFAAFGQAVPEEVAAVLNVAEINFQTQLDPPFWLADPPAKVSRELNAVVDLGVIDTALSNSAARVRSAKSGLEVCRSREQQARADAEALKRVPAFLKRVEAAEELDGRIQQRRARIASLRSLIEKGRGLERSRQRSSGAKAEALALKSLWSAVSARRGRVERLRELLSLARTYQARIKSVPRPPDALHQRVLAARARVARLRQLISTARAEEGRLCEANRSITQATEELRAVPNCPLCGGRLRSP